MREAPLMQDAAADSENIVRFNLQPRDDAPVLISAKDVQVSPDRGSLKFKLNRVLLVRAANETGDINPTSFKLRLYIRGADGSMQLVRESDRLAVLTPRLTRTQPRLEWRPPFEMRLYNVAAQCEKTCVIVGALEFFGGEAETAPTELHLMTGTGVMASRKAGEDPCRWLLAAQASAVVGSPMKYREPNSGDCTMVPESGLVPTFYYTVFDRPVRFNDQALRSDAENVRAGDRAVWIPSNAILWAVRGQRMVGLRMGPPGAPPAPTPKLREQAGALARAIISGM
ncbi:MAG: hypothetical protein DMF59_14030 [Acidobacteria bacterium]|nr:MAG: hypothetical protein DMF59_14030 [Acidobacteriota bacterium]